LEYSTKKEGVLCLNYNFQNFRKINQTPIKQKDFYTSSKKLKAKSTDHKHIHELMDLEESKRNTASSRQKQNNNKALLNKTSQDLFYLLLSSELKRTDIGTFVE